MSPLGWAEGTPKLSYIRRLGPFWWVKILNFNIFWVSRKINKPDTFNMFYFIFFGGGVTVDAGSKYTYQEKMRVFPLGE